MSIPVQNIYYLLCYAWDKLDERERVAVDVDDDTSLVDLFTKVLISGCSILLKKGFERNYVPLTEERVGVKGKLEVSESIKRNSFRHLKAVCSYDEYSPNILHNRILEETFHRLLSTENLDAKLKQQIRRLLHRFPPVDRLELKPATFQHIRIHRNNRFYEFLLNVCQIIYEYSLPTEEYGTTWFMDFTRDEEKMANLFEKFVYRFYETEMPELRPTVDQFRWNFESENDEDRQYLPVMKTDISLDGVDPKIIIDTKYYRKTMTERFEQEKIKSENLYQLFSYLLNQEDGTERTRNAKGILLYPTIKEDFDLHYRYFTHEIQVKTVNLNANWKKIDERLREIVGCEG